MHAYVSHSQAVIYIDAVMPLAACVALLSEAPSCVRVRASCVRACVRACVHACVRACALLIARMAWPARISRCKSFLRVAAAALNELEGEADERCPCAKDTFA